MNRSDKTIKTVHKPVLLQKRNKLLLLMSFIVFLSPVLLCQQIDEIPFKNNFMPESGGTQTWINSTSSFDEFLKFSESENNKSLTNTEQSGYTLFLDSISEVENQGYFTYLRQWYYGYNDLYRVDTVMRYFFNEYGMSSNTEEIRTYTASGKLKRFVRREPDTWRTYLLDTTMIDLLIEEYSYQDGLLVQKRSISEEYSYVTVQDEFHFYDTQGKIILDSVFNNGAFSYTNKYMYNSSDDLEYMIQYESGDYNNVTKYLYESTDTTRLTTRYWNYYNNPPEDMILDTISHWYYVREYHESFDEIGRRTTLMLKNYGRYVDTGKVYRAEFSYTDLDDLLHTSYYNWIRNEDEGRWKEVLRIDNTYDEEGNILFFEKTFYDDRTEFWELEQSKEYYYTAVSNLLSLDKTSASEPIIYPNPAGNYLRLKKIQESNHTYTIYNLNGSVLIKKKFEHQFIDISLLSPGIYLLEIESDKSKYTQKFIKL